MDQYTYADGKYTVINDNGKLSALRYGEPWRDLAGDNLVYWMLVETLRLAAPPAAPADGWQEEARRYCANADHWRERAEKAEAALAAKETL